MLSVGTFFIACCSIQLVAAIDQLRHGIYQDIVSTADSLPLLETFIVEVNDGDHSDEDLQAVASLASSKTMDFKAKDFSAPVITIMKNMKMFTVHAPTPAAIEELLADTRVKNITRDEWVFAVRDPINFFPVNGSRSNLRTSAAATTTIANAMPAASCNIDPYNWGLDRMDQRDNALDCKPYKPSSSTRGGRWVDIFIIDTGIQLDHVEFKHKDIGRVQQKWSFYP